MTEDKEMVKEDGDTGREKRFRFALSLARKAGKAVCGTEMVCESIRARKAELVILSASASANSKKRVANCAAYYNVTLYESALTPDELGASVGKTSLSSLAITDKNLAFIATRNIY